ncbi:hypothetical protein [Saccharothrix syringae]|uniref:Uncharacterized protein n=1 Tax=Saccharothrix syringae TaxID=103733 RepID=A0A5Q0H9S7_SACSY|nr:hypothetical protein [Saccharothrix syringae]QFZ22422.1 hypothetical protein EKG83_37845 [Saccharothrix syringae]
MTYPNADPRPVDPVAQPVPVTESVPVVEPVPAAQSVPVARPEPVPVLEPYGLATPATGQPAFPGGPQPAFPPAGAAPPRKRTGLVVVSVLAVLFLAVSGALGVLYVNEVDRNDSLTSQLSDKGRELTESAARLEEAREDATRAKDAQEAAEAARERAEDEGEHMAACRDAARAFREALVADDQAKGEEAAARMFTSC